MRRQYMILYFSCSKICSTNASIWLEPWSVKPVRLYASIFSTLSIRVQMFCRNPSWNTYNLSKINVNSSSFLFYVTLASPNATWSSITAVTAHFTCFSATLRFSCHSGKFSHPYASKSTKRMFVVRRPLSDQVLSTATSAHRFCNSSTVLSCIKLRDYKKYPTLKSFISWLS